MYEKVVNRYFIPLKISQKNSFKSEKNCNILGEAVPPVLPGEELIPLNVYGSTHNIPKLDLEKYLENSSGMEIVVADFRSKVRPIFWGFSSNRQEIRSCHLFVAFSSFKKASVTYL